MLLLKRLELLHEHVILIVGYCGRIIHVIELSVIVQLAAQFVYFLLYIHGILLLHI